MPSPNYFLFEILDDQLGEFFTISDLTDSVRYGRSKFEFFLFVFADDWYLTTVRYPKMDNTSFCPSLQKHQLLVVMFHKQ